MVAGEDYQDNRLVLHPHETSIISNEWLAIASLVCYPHIFQVPRKAVVHLLFLHDPKN